MKYKRKKILKLEKNRYSIITNDLEHCYLCGMPKQHLHEVFFGTKHRQLSMEYGLIVPLCATCHAKVHSDIQIDIELKKRLESAFIEVYQSNIEDFIKLFHINYL